jgi:monoamine oxidase
MTEDTRPPHPEGGPITPKAPLTAPRMTRREVLGTLASGALMTAGSARARERGPVRASPTGLDVIVIGAGLAGLSTAHLLKRQGARVLVLEARRRLGGRVHTQTLDSGLAIDLGPQFIGDVQKRISALVDECGLTRVRPHDSGHHLYFARNGSEPLRFSGDELPLSLMERLDALLADQRLERRLASFRTGMARWDSMPASSLIDQIAFTKATASFLHGYIEGEVCVPLDEISAYELLDQLASAGGAAEGSEQWFLAEGTQPLAQHLGARLGASVVLDAPVQRIDRLPDRITVETPRGSYSARQLVVATPPQLYERMGLLPLLPPQHARVIKGYRPGNVVKTLLVFERPWWRASGASGRVQSPLGPFNWAVDASPQDGRAGVLVLFATAHNGRLLGKAASEAARIDRAMAWLRTTGLGQVPPLLAARSIDWNADAWALGGYASSRGPGGWVEAPDLYASRGPIHFAGTETATEWRSFMEGALESAERTARAVIMPP